MFLFLLIVVYCYKCQLGSGMFSSSFVYIACWFMTYVVTIFVVGAPI